MPDKESRQFFLAFSTTRAACSRSTTCHLMLVLSGPGFRTSKTRISCLVKKRMPPFAAELYGAVFGADELAQLRRYGFKGQVFCFQVFLGFVFRVWRF